MQSDKKDVGDLRLRSWNDLNACLTSADEKVCKELLLIETQGRNRNAFKKRIHSRLNKVRAERERKEITNT